MSEIAEQTPPAAGPKVGEAEFAPVFRREIASHLRGLETERRTRLSRTRRIVWAALAICWAVAGLILFIGDFDNDLTLFFGAVGLILGPVIAYKVYRSANKSFTSEILAVVMPALCRFIGDLSYQRDPTAPPSPERFSDLLVVDTFMWSRLEDGFEGRHRNTEFRMVEAKLTKKDGKNAGIVFHGLLLVVQVPVPFSGRVILAQERGAFGNRLAELFTTRKHFEKVVFDDPPFEGLFAVYADLPEEARRLLTANLRATLVALAAEHAGEDPDRRFGAAFDAGEFLIALPRQSELFEIGDLYRPLDELGSEMGRLLTEVTIPHRVIDQLHGDSPSPDRRA